MYHRQHLATIVDLEGKVCLLARIPCVRHGDDMWSGVHLQGTCDYSPQQGVVDFIEVVLLNYDI